MAQTVAWQVSLEGTTLDNPGTNPNNNGLTVHDFGPYYWPVILSDPDAFPESEGKANYIYKPVGPDYGGANLLMRYADWQDMKAKQDEALEAWGTDIYYAFVVTCTVENDENESDPGANEITLANLWLLKATRVDYGALTDDSVFLVEFVDNAYYADQCCFPWGGNFDLAFNLRQIASSFDTGGLNPAIAMLSSTDDTNYWYVQPTIEYYPGLNPNAPYDHPVSGYTAHWYWETGPGPPTEYTSGQRTNEESLYETDYFTGAGGIFSAVWDYTEANFSFSQLWDGNYPSGPLRVTDNIQLPYNGGYNACSWPGLPYKPAGIPQNIFWSGRNVWRAMHSTLINRLGCTMVRRHEEQYRWDCVLLGDDQDDVEDLESGAVGNLIYDSATIVNPLLTSKLKYQVVHHRQTRMAGDFEKDSEIGTCTRLSQPAEIVESDQSDDSDPILTRVIHSDMPGYWFGEENSTTAIPGTDGTTLQQSADDFAKHQDSMWSAPASIKTYIGAVDFKPGSQIKSVLFHDYGDGMFTTTIKYPGPPRNLRSGDKIVYEPQTWADTENFNSPKARKSYKLVPDLCQVVKLTSGTGSSNLYQAQVVSGSTEIDCWAYCDATVDHLVENSYYIGRFYGRHSDNKAIFYIQDLVGCSEQSIVTSVSGETEGGGTPMVTTQKIYVPDRFD